MHIRSTIKQTLRSVLKRPAPARKPQAAPTTAAVSASAPKAAPSCAAEPQPAPPPAPEPELGQDPEPEPEQNQEPPFPLQSLPDDIIYLVGQSLPLGSRRALSTVNKRFHGLLSASCSSSTTFQQVELPRHCPCCSITKRLLYALIKPGITNCVDKDGKRLTKLMVVVNSKVRQFTSWPLNAGIEVWDDDGPSRELPPSWWVESTFSAFAPVEDKTWVCPVKAQFQETEENVYYSEEGIEAELERIFTYIEELRILFKIIRKVPKAYAGTLSSRLIHYEHFGPRPKEWSHDKDTNSIRDMWMYLAALVGCPQERLCKAIRIQAAIRGINGEFQLCSGYPIRCKSLVHEAIIGRDGNVVDTRLDPRSRPNMLYALLGKLNVETGEIMRLPIEPEFLPELVPLCEGCRAEGYPHFDQSWSLVHRGLARTETPPRPPDVSEREFLYGGKYWDGRWHKLATTSISLAPIDSVLQEPLISRLSFLHLEGLEFALYKTHIFRFLCKHATLIIRNCWLKTNYETSREIEMVNVLTGNRVRSYWEGLFVDAARNNVTIRRCELRDLRYAARDGKKPYLRTHEEAHIKQWTRWLEEGPSRDCRDDDDYFEWLDSRNT